MRFFKKADLSAEISSTHPRIHARDRGKALGGKGKTLKRKVTVAGGIPGEGGMKGNESLKRLGDGLKSAVKEGRREDAKVFAVRLVESEGWRAEDSLIGVMGWCKVETKLECCKVVREEVERIERIRREG